jgi:hypothetical protein
VLTIERRPDRSIGDEAQDWEMPEWLETYRHMISNTGDQTVEALMNDWKTGFHNDYMLAARLMSVNAQIELLERLRREGWLLPDVLSGVHGRQA